MVYPIYIPTLKERIEDIPILISFIIKKLNNKYGRSVKDIHHDALDSLMTYDWPGNVRELENTIGRAMINMDFKESLIEKKHMEFMNMEMIMKDDEIVEKTLLDGNKTLKETISRAEKIAIRSALEKTGGNRSKAADILGISMRTMYYKIKEYELS